MDIQLIYVLIALISALGLLLVTFVFLHLKSLKEIKSLRNDLDNLKKVKDELQNKTFEPVNNQARVIIDQANNKATEIIQSVQGLSESEKQFLNKNFQDMLRANLKDYQLAAGKFTQVYDSFVSSIGSDVKARLDMGLAKVIQDTQVEMKNVILNVNNTFSNLYRGFDTEVAEYKKGILKQIDKLGVDIIKQVSIKVLGKTLSKKEQEDLVIKSLEEAKKLGFFE